MHVDINIAFKQQGMKIFDVFFTQREKDTNKKNYMRESSEWVCARLAFVLQGRIVESNS